jgi:LPXTG-motif cell wall-anchored protein
MVRAFLTGPVLKNLLAAAALAAGWTALAGPRPAAAQSGAITGIVFADGNGNGLYDPGEQGIANVGITFSGVGDPVSGATNADGSYFFTANLGNWTVTVTPPAGFEVVGGPSKTINVAAAEQSLVVDFGLRPIQVQATNTAPPVQPTSTPGVLPQTGAAVSGNALALAALAVVLLAGVALVLSARWPRRR